MVYPSRPLVSLALILALGGLLFFYRLAARDLWSSHEARAAQNAQNILQEGCWGRPTLFDRHLELQKPPLYYWIVAGVAFLRGQKVDAWAVRAPAALAGLAGLLLVFSFGWLRGRPRMGFLAAAMLATATHYTWIARVGRIDIPLTLAVTAALLCYYQASAGHRERWTSRSFWLAGCYLAVALAVLLKGPVGAFLVFGVAVVHLTVEGQLSFGLIHRLGLWWGVPLLLVATVPVFWWVGVETDGAFAQSFFWHHNFSRAWGGTDTLAEHPWWFYGPRLAIDFAPWSLLLPLAAWHFLHRVGWRLDPEARFGLIWLAVMMVVLSCSAFKRADYLLPAFPGAALFLGCVAERWYGCRNPPLWCRRPACLSSRDCCTTRKRPFAQWAKIGFLLTSLLVIPAVWIIHLTWILPAGEAKREHKTFAQEIRRHAPPPQTVLFFRAEAHALAFHLGPPLNTFLEWENLDVWAGRPGTHYIIMPPECAAEWPQHVTSGRLEVVATNTALAGGRHEQPLVLVRTHSHQEERPSVEPR